MGLILSPTIVLADDGTVNADSGVIGIHDLVTVASVSSDTANANFPVSNLANEATYDDASWQAATTATQYVTVSTSAYGDLIDYMGLAGHNLGSGHIMVSVEADSGAGYVQIIAPTFFADDCPIMFRWTPAVYIAVRLKIWTGSATAAKIAVMYVGKLVVLQRRIYVGHTPITMGYTQQATNGQSESGSFLGRIVTGASNQNAVSLNNLTPLWYRQYFVPFVVQARKLPFFYAWRPGTYPLEVGFVWLTAMPVPTNDLNNGMMKVNLSLRGIVS